MISTIPWNSEFVVETALNLWTYSNPTRLTPNISYGIEISKGEGLYLNSSWFPVMPCIGIILKPVPSLARSFSPGSNRVKFSVDGKAINLNTSSADYCPTKKSGTLKTGSPLSANLKPLSKLIFLGLTIDLIVFYKPIVYILVLCKWQISPF